MATTVLTALSFAPAHAQEVIDGATETVIGSGGGTQASPWNIADQLFVGDGALGGLEISSGGIVTSDESFVGRTTTGNGNVVVDDAGSSWTSSGQIWVGYDGVGALTISNGASVSDTTGNIAFGTASTGTVVVTGSGSSWENDNTLYVSEGGTGYLTVSNGGSVSVGLTGGQIRIANDAGAYGEATVTGAGSTLDVADGTLSVGYSGTGVLNIQDTATVTAETAYIGNTGTSVGTVNVETGGVLDLSASGSDLIVGRSSGSQGTLNIDDGLVDVGDDTAIGNLAGSEGTIEITSASGQLETRDLYVGDGGTGVLNVTDGSVTVTSSMAVGEAVSGNGTVVNDGGTLDVGLGLVVGNFGTGTVTIQNSGVLGVADETFLGKNTGSVGSLTVDNANLTADNILVGDAGTGTLNAQAGATLTAEDVILGNDAAGSGTLNVTGTGTSLDVNIELNVGLDGTGTVNVEDGGTISVTDNVILGYGTTGNGTVTIDGAGSGIEATGGGTVIGRAGTGALTVEAGGTMNSAYSYIASFSDATGTVAVTGAGSTWTNTSDLYVGESGDGTLTIADGASVSNLVGYIGYDSGSMGTVTVTGASSSWTNTSDLYVGESGDGTLTIADGGTVSSDSSYIAYGSDTTGMVTVTGAGSTWNISDDLEVGEDGAGSLEISDGGTVSDSAGYIALGLGSTGTAAVTGSGSTWTHEYDLDVGGSGTATLTISDGGLVATNESGYTGTGVTIARTSDSIGKINIGSASGATPTGAGTLDSPSIEFGDGDATLVFNHTGTAHDFGADMSGDGTILHEAGETVLSGDSSGFTGATDVSGGTLYVNGTLAGTVNVSGGMVGGSGAIGNLTLGSGGSLAPGNSIGTLNVSNIAFNAGSTYTVELNDGGFVAGTNNDLLDATGTVTINGGTVHVTPENGTDDGSTYTAPGTYTIITATSVTGTFDSAMPTDDYVFLDFALGYDASNVYLNSEQVVFFSDIARTPNQQAIADPLEALGSGNAVYDALVGLVGNNDDARAAYDRLTGELHASAQTALLEDSRFPREAAMDRLRVALGGVGADNSAQIENRISESFGIWGQGFGSWSRWSSDGNAATMDRTIGGFVMGGDAPVWENARFGVLGGYSRSHVSVDDRASSGTADTYTLGVYGGGEWDAVTLTGGVAHSWHSLDTSRSVAFSGFSDSLSASYSARTLQAWGEAAYSFETGAARFEPFANLAYANLSSNGFTETGGAAALTAASDTVDATYTTLGLRAETDVSLGDMDATLRGIVGWRHAFGGTPASQMTFASGGNAFTIAGVPLAQDSLVLDAGFDVNLTDSASLGLAYGGLLGSRVQDHSASLNLNVRF